MSVNRQNKRKQKLGAIFWAGFFALIFTTFGAVFLFVSAVERPPLFVMVLFGAVYIAMAACVIAAGVQRVKEIEGGEEDEARKY